MGIPLETPQETLFKTLAGVSKIIAAIRHHLQSFVLMKTTV
jgi:hypothetical protein